MWHSLFKNSFKNSCSAKICVIYKYQSKLTYWSISALNKCSLCQHTSWHIKCQYEITYTSFQSCISLSLLQLIYFIFLQESRWNVQDLFGLAGQWHSLSYSISHLPAEVGPGDKQLLLPAALPHHHHQTQDHLQGRHRGDRLLPNVGISKHSMR